jgi:hypothetical protein
VEGFQLCLLVSSPLSAAHTDWQQAPKSGTPGQNYGLSSPHEAPHHRQWDDVANVVGIGHILEGHTHHDIVTQGWATRIAWKTAAAAAAT